MPELKDIYVEHLAEGEYVISVSQITDGLDVVVIDPPFEATAYLNDDGTISPYYGIGDGMSPGETLPGNFLWDYAKKDGEERDWTIYVRSLVMYDLYHARLTVAQKSAAKAVS